MNPWLGIALVLVVLGVLIAGLRLYQIWAAPHPELVRKGLHVGMGLVAISFPWIFERTWPVLLLGSLSLVGMFLLRTVKGLRENVGSIVSAVERVSLGEIYFALAVMIQWQLYLHEGKPAEYRTVLYCIPLLLLTLADAVAALVGVHYGRLRYTTSDGLKSIEGSFAFFCCAFFCVHIPLLLGTETGRLNTLLIALLLAWLAMMFEAIAWAGLDNLALPLVAHLLLEIYLPLSPGDLALRLAVTGGLTLFVLFYRTRTTLQGSAVIGACLVGYISWALGGWRWLLAPLTLFLAYTLLASRTEASSRRIHNIHAVVGVCSAGLIWLFLFRILGKPELFYLFTLAFASQLAIISIAGLGYDYPDLPCGALLGISILQGWIMFFVPYVVLEGFAPLGWIYALAALPGVAIAAVGFYFTQPRVHDCPVDTSRWLRQALHGALGSAVGLVPLYLV